MSNPASNSTLDHSNVADDPMSDAQIIALGRKHGLLWPNDPIYIVFARALLEESRPLASSRLPR
jgi:hypothetical protein